MKIRTRVTVYNAVVLLASLSLTIVLSLMELHERHRPRISQRGMEEMLEIILWVGIPSIFVSVGGGWWLMHKTLKPVVALTEAAERRNEANLGQQLPRSGNGDELDRLTEVLNSMNRRLNDSFVRIREFTVHASHELKTPLTILCGETEMALRDDSLSAAHREWASSQLEELRRLSRIVDALTLLTKADAGLIALALAPVRLDELVREAFADAEVLADPNGIHVELAACAELTVRGDADRLRQLLLNLADNAVKYNQPQGWITMALQLSRTMAEFTITNSGPGIPPEALPRVFDRFYRGDASHGNAVEGCGLGLSIAQWIVSAHGGSIAIASQPGKTTTVTVRLPCAPPPPKAGCRSSTVQNVNCSAR